MSKGPGLCEFLIEAELHQYFTSFKNDLKIQNVSQIKYVTDDDLVQLGMSKPEIRRLKKFFQKHYPQTYLSKFKKMIMPKKEENWEVSLPEEVTEKPAVKVPNKHIIPAESIIVNKELGMGEFGVVQQGVWTNDGERIQVAIKCLSRERMQNNPIEFLKEAAIMHSIDHEHIVRLYGVVLDTNALMLVTELAALRSLLECLKEPTLRSSFPVLSLCNFAIQICDGMQYLEAKRLIHRDLAARNILVFSKNKVKISDFGLSRALGVGKDYYQTNFNVNLKLPIAWCAPECITFLKFTSASDVWAYAVTLWEMFSYGFQPWAALTGLQILDAIDVPNCQRLERPECCPKEYYSLMRKCWHHDPNRRPKFSDLMRILPECKPEQVQAIQDSLDDKAKREMLQFRAGDIITVLDKNLGGSSIIGGSVVTGVWKGCMASGKTGLFNPAHTVSYLGPSLPTKPATPHDFVRGDGKNAYSSKRRLRPDMISVPQGDFKHTGHVGLDGAYFGDISFLGGSKYEHIPHQVVSPYKPQSDSDTLDSSTDRAPLIAPNHHTNTTNGVTNSWLDGGSSSKLLSDHEYHEISDEDTPGDSPRFEKQFDLGRSLMDEMDEVLRQYSCPPCPMDCQSEDLKKEPPMTNGHPPAVVSSHSTPACLSNNVSKSKRKQATVKPISAADEKTLDTAIALANELAMRTMSNSVSPSATTPPASHNKHKFTFKFPGSGGLGGGGSSGNKLSSSLRSEGRTFTDEAASIPDIQGCLTTEAVAAYSSLVEAPLPPGEAVAALAAEELARPRHQSAPSSPPPVTPTHTQTDIQDSNTECETNPLRMVRQGGLVRGWRGNATLPARSAPRTANCLPSGSKEEGMEGSQQLDENRDKANLIPLPPRDRARSLLLSSSKPRHERKHPLIIPTGMAHSLAHAHAHAQGHTSPQEEEKAVPGESPSSHPPSMPPPPPPQATSPSSVHHQGGEEEDEDGGEGFDEMIAESFDLLDRLDGDNSGDEGYDDRPLASGSHTSSQRQHYAHNESSGCDEGVVSDSPSDAASPRVESPLVGVAVPFPVESTNPFPVDTNPFPVDSNNPFPTDVDSESRVTETIKPFTERAAFFENKPFSDRRGTSDKSIDRMLLPEKPERQQVEKPVEETKERLALSERMRAAFAERNPEIMMTDRKEEAPEPTATVAQLVEKLDYKKELKAQLGTMSRVLHNKEDIAPFENLICNSGNVLQVSEDDCLAALETTGGNVHRGIKLARLKSLVGDDDLESLMACLESASWDVAAAASARLLAGH